jgi:hypothetical protein
MMIYTEKDALADGVLVSSSSTPTTTRGGFCSSRGRKVTLLVVAVVLAVIVVPVAIGLAVSRPFRSKSTTPGANTASGTLVVDGVGMCHSLLLDWKKRFDWETMSDVFVEGAPQILLLDDVQGGGHGSSEHSSTEYPGSFGQGYATSSDGTTVYEFTFITSQDQQVSFSIEGTLYDLSMGGLFLIRTTDGVEVQQIDVDMPVFYKSEDVFEAIQSFAESNDDILAFLKEISEQQQDGRQ